MPLLHPHGSDHPTGPGRLSLSGWPLPGTGVGVGWGWAGLRRQVGEKGGKQLQGLGSGVSGTPRRPAHYPAG